MNNDSNHPSLPQGRGFFMSHQEMSLLTGLPHFYQLLYVYLCAKVNRKTGLIGGERGQKISYQALSEWLFVEPGPGIKGSGSPTIKKFRVALAALERAGLITSQSVVSKTQKQLILYLPYTKWEKSVQKQADSDEADFVGEGVGRECSPKWPFNTSDKHKEVKDEDLDKDIAETAKVGTPQNNNILTHTLHKKAGDFLHENFEPTSSILQKATEIGVIEFHSPLEVQKFISYYRSHPTKHADWDSSYLRWLINAKQFQQQKENEHDEKRQHDRTAKRHWSAVDEVRRRNKLLSNHTVIDVKPDHEGGYRLALGEDDPLLRS